MAIPKPLTDAAAPPDPDAIHAGVRALMSGDPGDWRQFFEDAGQIAVSLAIAGLILIFTLWLSGWASRLVRRALGRIQAPRAPDATVQGFMASAARWVVIIMGLMAVLEQLGVRTTSILALIGAASIAVGLALQGALSNVAASVMLLILRPYRVGDVVEINGKIGTVKRLDLFVTELSDPDNLDIIMPNSKVFGEMIVNYSTPANRRMELNFSVDLQDDLDAALALLIQCAKADPRVLARPEPWSGVTAIEPSSVSVTVRAWARTDDYWDVRFDLIKRVKETLEAGGLSFPYPHQVSVERTPKPQIAAPSAQAPAPVVTKRRTSHHPDVSKAPSQGGN
jgi:small conductance mechanosensitive channel